MSRTSQKLHCIKSFHPHVGSIRGDTEGQVAVICRSNFSVFQEAAKKCNLDDHVRVAFAGVRNTTKS